MLKLWIEKKGSVIYKLWYCEFWGPKVKYIRQCLLWIFLGFFGCTKILEKHTLRGKEGSIQWNSIPLCSYFMHFFLSFSSQTRVCPWGASHPRRRSEKGCRGKENPTLNSYILRPKFLTNYYFVKQNCHLQRGRN